LQCASWASSERSPPWCPRSSRRSLLARYATTLLPVASFALPVTVPPIAIVQAWHPRLDADAPHRWLRQQVRTSITS